MRSSSEVVPAEVSIRRGVSADAKTAAELWLRSRRASIPAIPPPRHTDEEIMEWFTGRVFADWDTWVAEVDGAVAGLLVIHPEGWVNQLYLEPTHTGRGIGSRLLDLAKERNPGGLDLWAFQSNTGARRFYERHGFVNVAMTDGDNEEGEPDVRYHWPAPPTPAR